MTRCDVVPSTYNPLVWFLVMIRGGDLTGRGGGQWKQENPRTGIYTLVHSVSDVPSWDKNPTTVVSGVDDGAQHTRSGGHLFPLKSDRDL